MLLLLLLLVGVLRVDQRVDALLVFPSVFGRTIEYYFVKDGIYLLSTGILAGVGID